MFGAALLVCPVTKPMYYEAGSKEIAGVAQSRTVYLPAGQRWYDFWTDVLYDGGQTVVSDAPLDTMPLFVRAGSIVPMTQAMQFVDEVPDAAYEIRAYTGANAEFTLYEDAGDGYEHEGGAFALVELRWEEALDELTIGARQGGFAEMVAEREYRVVFIGTRERAERSVRYCGEEIRIKRNRG
jgi:alpha-D-xyloside xylohydrolase